MWSRKELKAKGKAAFKANYWQDWKNTLIESNYKLITRII